MMGLPTESVVEAKILTTFIKKYCQFHLKYKATNQTLGSDIKLHRFWLALT